MLRQYQPIPIRPFDEIYEYINDEAHSLRFLVPKIEKLETQLIADKNRGHINEDNLGLIKSGLLATVRATNELDVDTAKEMLKVTKSQCSYRRVISSRWSLIGAAIGAVLEIAVVAAFTFITKGLVLPVLPLNGILFASFTGALLGHKVGQWQAKRKISKIGDSIHSFFKDRGVNADVASHTPQDFSQNSQLKPSNVYEVASKLAAIHYQNLTITLEDAKLVLSEYLETARINSQSLDAEFIKKLLNTPLDKGRFLLKALLPSHPESFLKEAIDSLNKPLETSARLNILPL